VLNGYAQAVEKKQPVRQAGQRVVIGLVAHVLLGRLADADVPDGRDIAGSFRKVQARVEPRYRPLAVWRRAFQLEYVAGIQLPEKIVALLLAIRSKRLQPLVSPSA